MIHHVPLRIMVRVRWYNQLLACGALESARAVKPSGWTAMLRSDVNVRLANSCQLPCVWPDAFQAVSCSKRSNATAALAVCATWTKIMKKHYDVIGPVMNATRVCQRRLHVAHSISTYLGLGNSIVKQCQQCSSSLTTDM